MPDREKVIEALHCRAYDDDFPCTICAYYRPDEKPVAKCDYRGLMDDAIALLKEQEADKPKGHWMPYEPDKRGYTDGFICSRCERVILSDHYCKMIDFDFCPYCGAYMDNAEGR